jgi:hypothetical protein
MAFKNAHIFLPCLCTNWRHWRQWFLKLLSVLPTDLSNFSFRLKISTASLNILSLSPLRFQNCLRIPFPLAWRSASYVHREAGKGSETVWKSGFAYLFASKRLLTYALSDSLPFWLSNRQCLASLLADWSDWLIPLTDKLTYYRPGWRGFLPLWPIHPTELSYWQCLSSSLADVTDSHLVVFLSGWPIQLSSLTDRVPHFFSGWRKWLAIGCLPVSLIHPTEFCY